MIEFYKYHGAGNDFIMIDNRNGEYGKFFNTEKIKLLCDRHFGIGANGLILLEKSEKVDSTGLPQADCFMNYYNADGTKAEMCGNGVRCTAKFFIDLTKSDLKELNIDTRSGIKKIIFNTDDTFSVNMGKPIFESSDFPNSSLTLENIKFHFVSMGNPHAVGMVNDLNSIDISQIGPKIENDSHFLNKINVELVEKVSDIYFKVKVWERGSGATLACGTGACAVYAVLQKDDKNMEEITLEFPGGNLYLSQNEKGASSVGLQPREIILRGPAVCVFRGEIE